MSYNIFIRTSENIKVDKNMNAILHKLKKIKKSVNNLKPHNSPIGTPAV